MKSMKEEDPKSALIALYPRLRRAMSIFLRGSRIDADDVVQDAYIKAFERLDTFRDESAMYTWIYQIARNRALDLMRKKTPELLPDGSMLDQLQNRNTADTEQIDVAQSVQADHTQTEHVQITATGPAAGKPISDDNNDIRANASTSGRDGAKTNSASSNNSSSNNSSSNTDSASEQILALRHAIHRLPPSLREVVILKVQEGFSYEEMAQITGVQIQTLKSRMFRAKKQLHQLLSPH